MRKPASAIIGFALAAALALMACSEPPAEHDVPRGGWDGNSGNYNGNLGSFGTLSGLPGIPDWAGEPTGAGTVNNATIYGLQFAGDQTSTPCARATADLTDVHFLSSSGNSAAAIGPDLEIVRTGGATARLALGETVVFPGRIFDGYLNSIDTMFEVQRVDTLVYRNALWYEWPVFALRVCENSHADDLDHPRWKHMGFVSWAPFVRLPELDAQPFDFRTDLVQAVTTIPRVEYRNNPNVPQVVAAQTGALVFKFAFFSGAPVALHRESALDLQSSFGRVIANAEYIFRGGVALGNGSWVALPTLEDPLQHKFLSFFTKSGTEVAMFSVARGNGAVAGAVHLPPSWGGQVISALELTDDEKTPEAALCLDNVQAFIPTVPVGQRIAALPTHEGSGLSTYRGGLYLNSSQNNRKLWFFGLMRANLNATNVGPIVGRVQSQVVLENDMRAATGPAAYVVATESPLPFGTLPFDDETNVTPIPPGAPVEPPVMPIDAAVDAPVIDAAIDAGVDAAIDAPGPPIDAPADAGVDTPGPPIDAPADAGVDTPGPPIDAPADAGVDTPGPPIDAPADAAFDAPLPPIDAPTDAGMDALIDAPDAMDSGLSPDGNASCFAGCDDAPGPG